MSRRILITGAAGFIGSHACRAFLDDRWEVVGVDNFDPFYDRQIKEQAVRELGRFSGFRLVESDIRERPLFQPELAGVDAVLHLAALTGVRPSLQAPDRYASVNVGGTVAVLEACRSAGVKHIVFGSSSSVYGNSTPVPFDEDAPAIDPISPYAATKRAGEMQCSAYAELFDFRVAALRFFTVYGARQRPDLAIHKFTRLISAGETIQQFGDGTSERDYTHIDDIIQGVVAAVEWTAKAGKAFEIFNLGESRTVTLSNLIDLISDALGMKANIELLPPAAGDVDRTFANIAKARRVLAYDPQIAVEDGIPEFVKWYRATYGRAA